MQIGATAFFGAMTPKEVTTRGIMGDPGVVYKIGVDAFTMRSAAGLPATHIGANSSLTKGELALHAHGDVLHKLGEDLHRWVEDLVQGDVLAKEKRPVTSGGAWQIVPGGVLHNVGVPLQGRHGDRRRPDEDAGSGSSVSEVVLELEDEDEEGGERR